METQAGSRHHVGFCSRMSSVTLSLAGRTRLMILSKVNRNAGVYFLKEPFRKKLDGSPSRRMETEKVRWQR